MERSDADAKTGSPPEAEAFLGHTRERGGIAAEVGRNGDRSHEAGIRRRKQSLAQDQGPNIGTVAEVAVRAGSERKELRKCAERVEVFLPVHLPSGAETQLWMHKRL